MLAQVFLLALSSIVEPVIYYIWNRRTFKIIACYLFYYYGRPME